MSLIPGELGEVDTGGTFTYLKPLKLCREEWTGGAKTIEQWNATKGKWIEILSLSGIFQVNRIHLGANRGFGASIRVEWDGQSFEHSIYDSTKSSSVYVVLGGGQVASVVSPGSLRQLIVKSKLKVFFRFDKYSSENTGDGMTYKNIVVVDYAPCVVETL